jgi:hypothetical protein
MHCQAQWDGLEVRGKQLEWVEVPLAPGIYIVRVERFDDNDGYVTGAPRGLTSAEIDARFEVTVGGIHLQEDSDDDRSEIMIEVTRTHTLYVRGVTSYPADFFVTRYESPNLIAAASGDGRRLDPYTGPLR